MCTVTTKRAYVKPVRTVDLMKPPDSTSPGLLMIHMGKQLTGYKLHAIPSLRPGLPVRQVQQPG